MTDLTGDVTDTFTYDTYGKLLIRTGTANTPFLYNGRDGVMSDENGLVYMRARYYSPTFKRFINADVVAGSITNAITLNRYAYANGNPVSNVDPFGLSPDVARGCSFSIADGWLYGVNSIFDPLDDLNSLRLTNDTINFVVNDTTLEIIHDFLLQSMLSDQRPNNIGKGIWNKQLNENLKWVDDVFDTSSKIAKSIKAIGVVGDLAGIGFNVYENIQNGTDTQRIITDATVDAATSLAGGWLAGLAGTGATALATKIGVVAGTAIAPGVGTLIGAAAGVVAGGIIYVATEVVEINGKSAVEWIKEGFDNIADSIAS